MSFSDFTKKELSKRRKPEINERWWKEAWPGERPAKSGKAMINAIKVYKAARRGTIQSDLMLSLNGLNAATAKLHKEAASILSAVPKRKKAIQSDLDAFDILVEVERKSGAKFGTKTREVFRYDFAAKVMEFLNKSEDGRRVKLKSPMVKIELLEAIVQEIDAKNALSALFTQYSNALEDEVKKAAAKVDALVKARSGSNADNTAKLAQKILDTHADTLSELHHKAPTNVVRKLGLNAALEKQYQKELNKRRRQIAKSTVLTAASGVAIALPGTQAFAIYGFARSAAGLAQQLVEHNIKIATAAKLLQGHLIYLAKAFNKASKGVGRAVSETGGTTLNAVLGFDLVPTLDKATSSFKDLKLNTSHAGFKTQKLIDNIMGMMDSCSDLDKTVSSLSKTHPNKKSFDKNLARKEKKLDKLIKKTQRLGKQLNVVERKLPALGKALKDLGKNSAGQDFANYTVKVLINLGAIAGGGLVDATAATTAAGSAVEGAKEIAAMTIASIGEANELYETAKNVRDLAKS